MPKVFSVVFDLNRNNNVMIFKLYLSCVNCVWSFGFMHSFDNSVEVSLFV